ncbi:MAG TPA: vanadium-dependent haloperoxidase [Methylomirabilota bacterium]|nr:vanadium-dependent haloperoxidase [Methylomirabilota bacterium]
MKTLFALVIVLVLVAVPYAAADVVTDANGKAAEIASKLPGTPPAVRTMAIVQVSVFDAVNAVTGRYAPLKAKVTAPPGASVDAAVVSATRTVLAKLVPAQQAAIDADYQAALKPITDGKAKTDGIALGEQVATAVLAACAEDGAAAPNMYRPYTTPGVYVPTMWPAVPHWGKRKPWVMTSGDQFRPGPPPSLTSDTWKRDFEEIKAVGGKDSAKRTPEQTAVAKFWEATAPAVYWPVARSVANAPGRNVSDNARLLAVAAMAMDDALIAVMDAKYTYNFWRPVTAIRNAEGDTRDGGWMPFIDTPMHPEYPCAHCIVSGAMGAVLEAEIGTGQGPKLHSASYTAGGAMRSWNSVNEFVQEVSLARIYDGVHYRNSTEVGTAMGRKIGEVAVKKVPKAR